MNLTLFLAQTFVYCKKALKRLKRNRTQIFFTILFPMFVLMMMGFVFGGQDDQMTGFTVAVVNNDGHSTSVNGTISTNDTMSEILIDVIKEINITTIETSEIGTTDTNGTAMYLLARGDIDAYIVIPENFTEGLTMQYVYGLPNGSYVPIPISPKVEIVVSPADPVAAKVVAQTMRGIIDGFSNEIQKYIVNDEGLDPITSAYTNFLVEPVKSEVTTADVTVSSWRWITFMVPGILGIVILWSGFSNSAHGLARERDNGTLRRLVVATASPTAILLGEYLYELIVIFTSSAIALITGVVLFNVTLHWDILALVVLTLLVSMSVIGPGLIIASLARNAETASSIQTVVAVPLQFFVGSFFPLFLLPEAGRLFAMTIPYTHFTLAMTDIMVRGLTLADVWYNVLYITVSGIILIILGLLAYRRALQKL